MVDVVIGDIHARQDALHTLLYKIGIINSTGERLPGYRIHQLGDALSLGYGEQEADFFKWFLELISPEDVLLLGNHELPAVWGNHTMDFHGWDDRDVEAEEMVKDLFRRDRYRVASHVGDWLLTHAGLIPTYQKTLRQQGIETAADVAGFLNERFVDLVNNKVNEDMYERYGIHGVQARAAGMIEGMDEGFGGIFWVRTRAHVAGYRPEHHLKQMFGHTPYGPKQLGEYLWLLDTAPRDPDWLREQLRQGIQPKRSDFGDVAAMVFETPESDPQLVRPYC